MFNYPYFLEDEDDDEDVPATAPSLTVIPGGADGSEPAEPAERPTLTVVSDEDEPTNPLYRTAVQVTATDAPGKLTFPETAEVRKAAHKARKLWPGPVGDLVYRELTDYANFAFRFERFSIMQQLLQYVIDAELPPDPPPAAPAAAAA